MTFFSGGDDRAMVATLWVQQALPYCSSPKLFNKPTLHSLARLLKVFIIHLIVPSRRAAGQEGVSLSLHPAGRPCFEFSPTSHM